MIYLIHIQMSVKYLNSKYKKNLKMVESILGRGITNGEQLESLARYIFGARFRGVFSPRQKLPVLREAQFVIINKPANQHWIAAYRLRGKLYEYDSFDRDMLGGKYLDGDVDGRADQRISQSNCGQRVLAHVLTVLA
jgi:hypothetical protein